MGEYLIVAAGPSDESGRALLDELAQLARSNGMTVSMVNENAWLGTAGPNPAQRLRVGAWTLIGDVFNRQRPRVLQSRHDDPFDYERKLVARFWGRFIGIRFGADQRPDALLRDPSGAVECVAWNQDGLTLVCSQACDWLIERLRPNWRINVDRLASALHDPLAGGGSLLIDGPTALTAGTVQPLPLPSPAEAVWRPATVAQRSLEPAPSPEEARHILRAAIDEAVCGLASLPGPLAAEVSGGLDSSLVAASLIHAARAPVGLWLNAYGGTPEADERIHARTLGDALGFAPLCIPHATKPMAAADLEAPTGFRPNVAVLDAAHDLAWAHQICATGATAVMTGKGGDSIFIQAPSTDVFIDLWRARGWKALRSPDMAELAATNEISLWTMVGAARRHRRLGNPPLTWDHPVLTPLSQTPDMHPWLRETQTFGPAKAFQIAGVADSVSHNTPTALSAAVDVRNPLGAQPVVEACLALPTWLLTTGGRDRGLARSAFRDRLPDAVLSRRSKGDMTRLYSRMILDNLAFIRPWLIEGRLAALGILDPAIAEIELTPETLMWRGRYAPLMAAIAFEGWVRAWERRLAPSRPALRRHPDGAIASRRSA